MPDKKVDIDVVIVTWPNRPERWTYFQQTLGSLLHGRLSASRHEMRLLVSAESHAVPDWPWFGPELETLCKHLQIPLHWKRSRPGLGSAMNHALRMCQADYILLVQDDCELIAPLDLSPHIDLLADRPEVDMIRFEWSGDPRISLGGPTFGNRRFQPGRRIYSDRPHLRRRTFADKWGWYTEAGQHGHSEVDMENRLRRGNGVVLAADRRYFQHTSEVSAVPGRK